MKKEWVFFCVFFGVNFCPSFLRAPLIIVCFSFPVIRNNPGIPANIYTHQPMVAGTGNSEFLLTQTIAPQNKKTLSRQHGCCTSNGYIKNSFRQQG